MATVTTKLHPATLEAGNHLRLSGVSWNQYIRLLRILDDRHLRLSYDRGELEIMTLSPEHERLKGFLRRLFEVMVLALGVEVIAFGSMTCRRRSVKRGLEPDECYYIASEPLVRGKDKLDLRHDPPPDLAMEVDVTRSSLNRLAIYAKLQIPEVWRFDGQSLTFHLLGADGIYAASTYSLAFPKLKASDLLGFLNRRAHQQDGVILEEFRTWVVHNLSNGPAQP